MFYLTFIIFDISKICITSEKISLKDEKWNNKILKKNIPKENKTIKSKEIKFDKIFQKSNNKVGNFDSSKNNHDFDYNNIENFA